MKAELGALEMNNTWTIVDLPPGKHPIGCKWVYKIKYHANGKVERYKARLVAKGYTQIEGKDYFQTYSPVAKMTTVRTVLALAAINDWHLEQLDVNNAFLHGDLNEEGYMCLPPGIATYSSNKICKLNKSLYGLKQARMVLQAISKLLLLSVFLNLQQIILFVKKLNNSFTAISIYVDDIVLARNDLNGIQLVTAFLDSQFRIKDLGNLRYFLGLEIARSKKGIVVNQRKYTPELLADCGLLAAKGVSIPMDPSIKLPGYDGKPYHDEPGYRRLIGKLIYLTSTRPDIAFVMQQLSQFMSQPMDSHMNAAQKVLKYLKSAPAKGLFFSATSTLKISAFSNSDWASCLDTRRSVSGYCVLIVSSLISWKSKKQSTVSRSSSEAEYRALAALTCELQWLYFLFKNLQAAITTRALVYCDNRFAIHIAHNPIFHERTKHIANDCHVLWEKLQSGLIHLLPIPSSKQPADIFTKALHSSSFHTNIHKLGLLNIMAPT